jgi:hypothetical protein
VAPNTSDSEHKEAPESRRGGIGLPLAQSATNEIDFGDFDPCGTRIRDGRLTQSCLRAADRSRARCLPARPAVVAMARKSVIWGFGRNDDRQLAATTY